jgi:ribosomal protein L37AE/L43A
VKSLSRLGVYGTTGRPFYQCAQCGAPIIADTWSEYVSERQVRNVWSCDACGYQFETAAYFPKVDLLKEVAYNVVSQLIADASITFSTNS